MGAEHLRLEEATRRTKYWRRWGPYVSERQWGTVREDYSPNGDAWNFFPFEHAHLRAYRWGEDGLAGFCDNHQRLCLAIALWNGVDPILKERLYGLTNGQGNHGEDVKELYYYLDSTPTHSYNQFLYKYPQGEYPYRDLRDQNIWRTTLDEEFELWHTGALDSGSYWDLQAEYAKNEPDDLILRITVTNRGASRATLHVLPTLWFRNRWSWGLPGQTRPKMRKSGDGVILLDEPHLGAFRWETHGAEDLWFTENDSNTERLWGYANGSRYYKDGFHERLIGGRTEAINPNAEGTKACGVYTVTLNGGESRSITVRLVDANAGDIDPDAVIRQRAAEADEFFANFGKGLSADARRVQRQAFAGLLWSKQHYHYVIEEWLTGDPAGPEAPAERLEGRNSRWKHLFNDDVISMPDKWEYPWYAAWDLAFHMIPLSLVDPELAKRQLSIFLREWYMHPSGKLPSYEWSFDDVNPPVHAWACWRVFKIDARRSGRRDWDFLESAYHKLLMNFTWWVNRKDSSGDNIFEGGFLGLDNIGIFDRNKPLPSGGRLEQSDGTSWMAAYCLSMLRIALELAKVKPVYEDIASKFFEHFLYIASAMNRMGDQGLWDEKDGFFYDRIRMPSGRMETLRLRSMVGLIPLFAVEALDLDPLHRCTPGFLRRTQWFIENRPDLCESLEILTGRHTHGLLAVVTRPRLVRLLETMLAESEFLSPYGIRSLSRYHLNTPYVANVNGGVYGAGYEPAESTTRLFGGNSNWRGPVWFPVNYLIIESLQKFHHFYGDSLTVECPAGSGVKMDLGQVAAELSRRLSRLFLLDESGRRPCFGDVELMQNDPEFRDRLLFHEYFHGDTGAGLGASHQTGWTALVAKLLEQSGE